MNNLAPSVNSQRKDKKYLGQYRTIRKYFFNKTASRFMASVATGIPLQNVCRYVATLRDLKQIAVIRKDLCRISGEKVEFLSTNPELFPIDQQKKLFEQ